MKVTKQETLYHEDYGATLKHKCCKRIVTLSLLSFSLIIFLGLFSFFVFSTQTTSSYSIPPIVLCPWLALMYCVRVEKAEAR